MLVIAYKPKEDLLSVKNLKMLAHLSDELEALPLVVSVDSILCVPLLFSPPQDMSEMLNKTRTLRNTKVDPLLAKHEFLSSPLYKDSLVNKDFTVTSVVIHLKEDILYKELLEKRNTFKQKQEKTTLSKDEKKMFEQINSEFKKHRDTQRVLESQNIQAVRSIIKKYQNHGKLFLGGVQMISNDIIGFVKSDLAIYGSILILLLILVLGIVFRKPRWIVIPILICTLSVIAITSALGYWGWEITVISSNFIALQLIITISIVLHLIVRYEELLSKYPKSSQYKLILNTILSKITPTFFAIITTIAGFSSLLFSHIHPVINLGWMMSAGIVLSFIISFIVFPSMLMLLPKTPAKQKKLSTFSFAKLSSHIILHDKKAIFMVTFLSIVFSITGASQLIVENSFINYFKKDTNIYKGMKVIDQELGGTTPLDVILTFHQDKEYFKTSPLDDEEDSFEDEFNSEEDQDQYWFTDEKIGIIHQVQNYLYDLKATGDVQSFATILDTGKILNHDKALDSIEIALLYKKLPQKYRESIISPYVNIAENQVRFSARIKDSNPGLRRNEFLEKIKYDLSKLLNPKIVSYQPFKPHGYLQ